jgi:hypothetical protein
VAYVCQKHCSLRTEIESLQLHYNEHIEYANNYATRLAEAREQLDDLLLNADQFFYDALDTLSAAERGNGADEVAKPPQNG